MTGSKRCSVDAQLSNSPHTADQPHPDWHIVTASGQEFYACDRHVSALLYFDGPNIVTSTANEEDQTLTDLLNPAPWAVDTDVPPRPSTDDLLRRAGLDEWTAQSDDTPEAER